MNTNLTIPSIPTSTLLETLQALEAAHAYIGNPPSFSDRAAFDMHLLLQRTTSYLKADLARVLGRVPVSDNSTPPLQPNQPGHVCPITKRVAMTVADAYAREDSADRHFWRYYPEATGNGTDPWRMIEGIDATTETGADGRPVGYTLDFLSGGSREVKPDAVVYMQPVKGDA